jgi:hypothetical protein
MPQGGNNVQSQSINLVRCEGDAATIPNREDSARARPSAAIRTNRHLEHQGLSIAKVETLAHEERNVG